MLDLGEQEYFVGYQEAADWSGMTVTGITQLARSGAIPKTKVGSTVYIPRKPFEQYLIENSKHPDPWPDKSVPHVVDPVPVVGFDTSNLSSQQIGNAGEHLSAFYVCMAGATVSLVDRRGMDHFVRLPNGRMLALEVKTTRRPELHLKGNGTKYPIFKFNIRRKDADWFCLLDLSTNICLFRSKESLCSGPTVHVIPDHFTVFNMNRTLTEMFRAFDCEPEPILERD